MPKYLGIIPAAGIGSRMGSQLPKQFMKIGEKSILEWTVDVMVSFSKLSALYLGLSSTPDRHKWVDTLHPKIGDVYQGGQSRSETVLFGLEHILNLKNCREDWVLVHDANRPLLRLEDLERLVSEVGDEDDGGILCLPLHDTIKHGIRSRVKETIPRNEIFSAQTPQLFKIGLLHDALSDCLACGINVTDESQAMEIKGFRPKLVIGSPTNIKITTPADLNIAQAFLDKT